MFGEGGGGAADGYEIGSGWEGDGDLDGDVDVDRHWGNQRVMESDIGEMGCFLFPWRVLGENAKELDPWSELSILES